MKDTTKIALFDWGGVIEPFAQWDDIWKEIAALYNKEQEWYSFENDFYAENQIFETTRDIVTTNQIIERYLLSQGLSHNDEDIVRFKNIYVEHFSKTTHNEKIIEFIQNELQPIVTTGIFSNIGILDCIRQGVQTKDYSIFDHQFLSCDIGYMKPNWRAFEIIEKQFAPQNIYFVDDSPANIEMAKNRGWNTLQSTDENEIIDYFKNHF